MFRGKSTAEDELDNVFAILPCETGYGHVLETYHAQEVIHIVAKGVIIADASSTSCT